MIDVSNIMTGDCLIRAKREGNKLCFVIFPFMAYNVCMRHEYEWTKSHIRITRYLPIAPSDLKDYDYIPVVSFKKVAQIFNEATEQAFDEVRKAPKGTQPCSDKESALLYKCITGDYILTTFNQEAQENGFMMTVSPSELSFSDKPPQDWQIGGAEKSYVDLHVCDVLKDLFEVNRNRLLHEFFLLVAKILKKEMEDRLTNRTNGNQ